MVYLNKKIKANSILQYTITLGIVAIALFAMSKYIQRGFQGQVKDMTDNFLSGGDELQAVDANVRATSKSDTGRRTDSGLTTYYLTGGKNQNILQEGTTIGAHSTTTEEKSFVDTEPSAGGPSKVGSVTGQTYQGGN